MSDDISYIRKWIKKGLSKDKKTLDFSGKGISNEIAEELAETSHCLISRFFFCIQTNLRTLVSKN